MMKKRGISMIAILLTLAVIIAISTVAIFEYRSIVVKSQKRELASDYYAMQTAIQDYEFVHGSLPLSSEVYVSVPVSNKEQFSSEPGYASGKIDVYYVDYNKLNVDKLVRGMQKDGIEDRYVYSKWTNKIYYLQGATIAGTTYYTLNDELYGLLEIAPVK